MPVKIRLARRGRKKRAMYDVVVADSRAPRDGRFIEKIGTYNPNTDPAIIKIDDAKAFDWVMKGAQPTDTVKAMLSYKGIMLKKHLQVGVSKGALTQEEADKKLAAWIADKEGKIQGKVDQLAKDKNAKKKAALEAEAKVNKARQDAILAKKKVAEEALAAEVAEANADEAETELEQEGEAAIGEVETAVPEEAPVADAEATVTEEITTESEEVAKTEESAPESKEEAKTEE
jgi:small subunit ribosomal protein S16